MAADRVLLVDAAQVGVATAIIKVLNLQLTVDVCAWQGGPQGLIAYVNADSVRQLAQTGARDEA